MRDLIKTNGWVDRNYRAVMLLAMGIELLLLVWIALNA
jgi:hypothetical protein